MLRPGDARRRMERTLNAAYGDGLLSHQTLVQRLDLLFGSELVDPAGLVGDLTLRRPPRRALSSAAWERLIMSLRRAAGLTGRAPRSRRRCWRWTGPGAATSCWWAAIDAATWWWATRRSRAGTPG